MIRWAPAFCCRPLRQTVEALKGPFLIALAATIFRFLLRHLVAFVLICAVLLFGKWAWAEWQAHQSSQAELAQLTAANERIARDLNTLTTASQGRMATFASASLDALTSRIDAVDQETRRKQLERQKASAIGGTSARMPRPSTMLPDQKRTVSVSSR